MPTKPKAVQLPTTPLRVVNLGLELFADSLRAQEVPVVQVAWRPPAGGNQRLATLLGRMYGDRPPER
ncbi:MAG TPA: hypothetical protein VKB51_13945 [bacterium]|nr:hypothetical protein [bacterium]